MPTSYVSNEQWTFVGPYLALVGEEVPKLTHDLRNVLNGFSLFEVGAEERLCVEVYATRGGDLPPWEALYQHRRRRLSVGASSRRMVHNLRLVLRLSQGRAPQPTGAILHNRTLGSTPQSGSSGGYDAAKRKKGSRRCPKVSTAACTLGELLALRLTPPNEHRRESRGESWPKPSKKGAQHSGFSWRRWGAGLKRGECGLRSRGAWHPFGSAQASGEQTRLLVLLPRRWVVEGHLAWASRFRRLLKETARGQVLLSLAGVHFAAFACLFSTAKQSPSLAWVHNTP